MMNLGKASAVGYKTIGLYLLTTIAACLLGIIATLVMKGQYEQKVFTEPGPSYVSFACNADGAFLAEDANGNVMCTSEFGSEDNMQFIMDDISGAFVKKSGGARNDISLSDTVYDGVFTKLITDNIVSAFNTANFAGIIVFAIVFGVGLSGVLNKMHGHGKDKSVVIKFLEEVDGVLLQMINWIIMATPCKWQATAVILMRFRVHGFCFSHIPHCKLPSLLFFLNSCCFQFDRQGRRWTGKPR